MPEKRKDTKLTAQEEEAKLSPDDLEVGGELSAAAYQLAAVTLADDEAGTGTGTGMSETQQDSTDKLYDPSLDPELWKPHPPTEDCPVCFVPLPLEFQKQTYMTCCGKMICEACKLEHIRALEVTNRKRVKKELPPLDRSCPFCRVTAGKDDSGIIDDIENLIAKGDDEAVVTMAFWRLDGKLGFPKDEAKGIELVKRAADMGSARAMLHLGAAFIVGGYGVPKDKKRGIGYLEDAVKVGSVGSRYILGEFYEKEDNFHLAVKHARLAAEAGHKAAIEIIWKLFYRKELSKEDLEEILRAHQSACDKIDSDDRRRLEAYDKALAGTDDMVKNLYRTYYEGTLNAKQLRKALGMHQKGCNDEEITKFVVKCYYNV